MHPVDCPGWEYTNNPTHKLELRQRAASIMRSLRLRLIDCARSARDTRECHEHLFESVTPNDAPYYAGHYRGENFRCLRYYRVQVGGDDRVGAAPRLVLAQMATLATTISAIIAGMDRAVELPGVTLSSEQKLIYAVAFASRAFEEFLRIHPYANGNGHAARLLVCAIMGRYGYWPNPSLWYIDPRPANPSYTRLIQDYRNGNVEGLEKYLLSCFL